MANPDTADIRRFLTETFSDAELTAFCFDYFRDVYDEFASGMTKGQKIQLLIEHCERRENAPSLRMALHKERQAPYTKRFGTPQPIVLTIESPIHLELVRVPAGEFLMGSNPTDDKDVYDDEKPQHRVYVPEFCIGKYPVTNDQYAAFVKTMKCEAPKHWAKGQIPSNKGDHPVVNVTWKDAVAFCEWLRQATDRPIRLPTEAEWEKAARGTYGRIYPWGNQAPDKTLCNFARNIDDTTPVGQYPQGVSPFGALDMAGNVWEWTGSLWGKNREKPDFGYPYDATDGREQMGALDGICRVVRGGSWGYSQRDARCSCRGWHTPDDSGTGLGFRIVASPLHS